MVVDADTGAPLQDATLVLTPGGAATAQDGTFDVDPTSTATIVASAPGHFDVRRALPPGADDVRVALAPCRERFVVVRDGETGHTLPAEVDVRLNGLPGGSLFTTRCATDGPTRVKLPGVSTRIVFVLVALEGYDGWWDCWVRSDPRGIDPDDPWEVTLRAADTPTISSMRKHDAKADALATRLAAHVDDGTGVRLVVRCSDGAALHGALAAVSQDHMCSILPLRQGQLVLPRPAAGTSFRVSVLDDNSERQWMTLDDASPDRIDVVLPGRISVEGHVLPRDAGPYQLDYVRARPSSGGSQIGEAILSRYGFVLKLDPTVADEPLDLVVTYSAEGARREVHVRGVVAPRDDLRLRLD